VAEDAAVFDLMSGGQDMLYPAAPQLLDRIWQATFSVGGGARAGKAGDGLMLSRTQPRTREAPKACLADLQHPIIDAYLAALPPGREPRILGSRTLFVADDREEALGLAEIGLRRIVDHFVAVGHIVAGESLAELIAAFDVHVGTPDDVIASLSADSTLERVTDLVFQVHSIDPPHAYILRSLELIAQKVAPALGWRGPNVATPADRPAIRLGRG
jgi:alkanesulfonate monooxygenase SsuD/methylene tetrahydromethanopterin reductase-like flavin-dependent oxidoreductase (luciferase family)